MRLYADLPARRTGQVVSDLVALALVYLAVQVGLRVHDRVLALAGPGRSAEESARSVQRSMRGAADDVGGAPVVGGTLAKPFHVLAASSRDLAGEAVAYQDAVGRLATLVGLVLGGVLVVVVLLLWLPRRLRWVIEASAASRLLHGSSVAADVLAVRALARQPLRDLARVEPWVIEGWRARDPDATAALAQVELDELGLRV